MSSAGWRRNGLRRNSSAALSRHRPPHGCAKIPASFCCAPGVPMTVVPEVAALVPDIRSWRHHIHAHPETAFEEKATSAFVADKLRSFGLDVHAGLAGTGVV